MSRRAAAYRLLLVAVCVLDLACAATAAAAPAAKIVKPEELWWKTSSPSFDGWDHNGKVVQFADPEGVIGKGPITRVDVWHAGFVHGLRLWYGKDGVGLVHGFTEGIPVTEWKVPEGEKITRVRGEIADGGRYVSRLQFFTDGGHASPVFGAEGGRAVEAVDGAGGALRTLSGAANLVRKKSIHRAVTRLVFRFGAPYFIKKIDYDLAALEAARLKTAPERCASQDFTNGTSVEQTSAYENSLKVSRTTTLSFEQSLGLSFGATAFAEASVGLVTGGVEVSWQASVGLKSGQSFSNSRETTVSWSVPVKVPPRTRVVATSTWRKYQLKIPFTYTVAWYEGTRDNIKHEVTLPGTYEDVRVDDLTHVFTESPLDPASGIRTR